MDMVHESLTKMGLSKNESKIYLSLLPLSISTANSIAKKTGIHHANVYDSLERLISRGLVSYIFQDGKKCFRTTSPTNLISMVKEQKKIADTLIPIIRQYKCITPKKTYTETLKGIKAFGQLLNHFLTYKDSILVYGIPKKAANMLKYNISNFHRQRIRKKIVMKHIYNFNAIDRINFLNSKNYTYAKYLNEEFDSKVSTNICGPEVIVAIWNDELTIIRIIDPGIAKTYKNYFQLLWNSARYPQNGNT